MANLPGAKGIHGARCIAVRVLYPGMIMNAASLLLKTLALNAGNQRGMQNNLCRCGTYNRIIEAVHTAQKR